MVITYRQVEVSYRRAYSDNHDGFQKYSYNTHRAFVQIFGISLPFDGRKIKY